MVALRPLRIVRDENVGLALVKSKLAAVVMVSTEPMTIAPSVVRAPTELRAGAV